MKFHVRMLLINFMTIGALLLLAACASSPTYHPDSSMPEGDWKARAQSQQANGIEVTAAVPSAKEARELFGMPLYKKGIQPVWLRISNSRETGVNFLPVGLDPQYFTPLEVANADLKEKDAANPTNVVDEFFIQQGLGTLSVEPGETRTGFIFSKLDEGTKAFNVDIIGSAIDGSIRDFDTFTFFIPVPGLNIDHYNVDWRNLYADDEWTDLDDQQLIEILEKMTCCVTDKKGKGSGDPLNLVIIGKPRDIYTAFIRAGWDETETVTRTSTLKTIGSFLSGGEYRYSPISGLYVFGRPQDVAFQKARENIHERNHLRLWMSSATYEGEPVFIGQISRDIGVRFTSKTITTHKIDPDVDETREYLLENLVYAQALEKFGYVGGVGEVSFDNPQGNLTGDPWFSDGHRLVLWVTSEPVAVDDLEFVEWRRPY
jgi:hypothetical protein